MWKTNKNLVYKLGVAPGRRTETNKYWFYVEMGRDHGGQDPSTGENELAEKIARLLNADEERAAMQVVKNVSFETKPAGEVRNIEEAAWAGVSRCRAEGHR